MSKAIIKSLKDRIFALAGRAVLKAVYDDKSRQRIQFEALRGEVKDEVEHMQHYGFSAHPLIGAQVFFLCQSGNRDHPVALAVDDPRYRPKDLEAGEVIIYTDEEDYIRFKRGNIIEIKAQTKLVIDCPSVEVTGDLIDRTASGNSDTVQNMRDIYNGHTHTGDDGGTTSAPHQDMGGSS